MRPILTMPAFSDPELSALFAVRTMSEQVAARCNKQGVFLIYSPATGTPQHWSFEEWHRGIRDGYIMVPELSDTDKFFIECNVLPEHLPALPRQYGSTFKLMQGRRASLFSPWNKMSAQELRDVGHRPAWLGSLTYRRDCFTAREMAHMAVGVVSDRASAQEPLIYRLTTMIREKAEKQSYLFHRLHNELMVHWSFLPLARQLAVQAVKLEELYI